MTGSCPSAALRRVEAAFDRVNELSPLQDAEESARAKRVLHAAVDAAREVGVEWGRIGDVLGIARGNAYQRYRRRQS